ncbi:uncharacterized protein LOC143290731, partial [Babylonia areolata]|uniref:uncharacterized protein LOC143290731 n=1 Tax=Babylonia areolata TaxID=304850 RepID=UPI003FCFA884
SDAGLLQLINDRKAKLLLPDILVIVLFLLLGLLGNPLAIYIYGWRWQPSSTKIFLFALAVIDLMNCLITIPTEIVSMRNYYNFPSDGWCKVSRFTTYVMNNATVVIFLSIAVDRYIRICHPYRSAVSERSAKVACGIGLLIGLLVAWPALFLYGKIEIKVPDESDPPRYVTGFMCIVHESMEQFSLAFFGYLCSACFVCTLILVILYTLIGRAILKRKRLARRRKEAMTTTLENFGGAKNGSVNGARSLEASRSVTPTPPPPPSARTRPAECVAPEEESLRGCNVQNFSIRCKKLRPPKATLMLFLITVVFVTSFLPFLIISIIRHHRGPAFYLRLSPREQVVVNIFIRSYIVNNCTNPIVYGLCNSQFREECQRLYRGWCRRGGSPVTSPSFHHNNSVLNRSRTLYETPKLERKVSPES